MGREDMVNLQLTMFGEDPNVRTWRRSGARDPTQRGTDDVS